MIFEYETESSDVYKDKTLLECIITLLKDKRSDLSLKDDNSENVRIKSNIEVLKILVTMSKVDTYDDKSLLKETYPISVEELSLKLKLGANPNIEDNLETPLLVLVGGRDEGESLVKKVKLYFDDLRTNPNVVNNYGYTPLSKLIDRMSYDKDMSDEVFNMFLKDERVDLTRKDNDGKTYFIKFCEYINFSTDRTVRMFETFTQHKQVDPTQPNQYGNNALDLVFKSFDYIKRQ